MRHQNAFRKFSRKPAHRRAMFRNLATALIERERCETTLPKAKDLRRVVEKLITLASTDTVANRRHAYGYLESKDCVHKLFVDVGPRFRDRKGGYTRVVRTRTRVGDAAEMAVIELVQDETQNAKGSRTSSEKTSGKEKSAPKSQAKATKSQAGSKKAATGKAGSSEQSAGKQSTAKQSATSKKAPAKKAASPAKKKSDTAK